MRRPLQIFDRVFVINLPSRRDRRQEMDEQLKMLGLGLGSGNVELFPAIRPTDAGDFPSIGTRGCFLSHLGVLRRAAAAGHKRILLLEDDANFAPDFTARMHAIEIELSGRDWAFFYGGHKLDQPIGGAVESLVEIPSTDGVQTAHCVGMSGSVLPTLISYLEAQLARPTGDPRGGPMHVDGSYTWFRKDHPELVTLASVKQLAYQRASRTDIHDLRWHDRAWGVRSIVSYLRKLRNGRARSS